MAKLLLQCTASCCKSCLSKILKGRRSRIKLLTSAHYVIPILVIAVVWRALHIHVYCLLCDGSQVSNMSCIILLNLHVACTRGTTCESAITGYCQWLVLHMVLCEAGSEVDEKDAILEEVHVLGLHGQLGLAKVAIDMPWKS